MTSRVLRGLDVGNLPDICFAILVIPACTGDHLMTQFRGASLLLMLSHRMASVRAAGVGMQRHAVLGYIFELWCRANNDGTVLVVELSAMSEGCARLGVGDTPAGRSERWSVCA